LQVIAAGTLLFDG